MHSEELHINVKCELYFLSQHDLWTKNTSELKQVQKLLLPNWKIKYVNKCDI